MAAGRRLRDRFRDESPVAVLMEIPTWLFLTLTVVVALVALGVAAAVDVTTRQPNIATTVLSPVLVTAFCIGLFWLASRERLLRRRRLDQIATAYQLFALMPDEMADVAAELYRLRGYVVTENKRPDLADGGVDFEIAKEHKTWLVQVKHWRQEVGVKEVRELWGIVASEGAAGGVLIGTSGFSQAAREFAEGKDLELIDGAWFMKLREQLPRTAPGLEAGDPMVSPGFVRHLNALRRPKCPDCGKSMVLVTHLHDVSVAYQFWGCSEYPQCEGTRKFNFPYVSSHTRDEPTPSFSGTAQAPSSH